MSICYSVGTWMNQILDCRENEWSDFWVLPRDKERLEKVPRFHQYLCSLISLPKWKYKAKWNVTRYSERPYNAYICLHQENIPIYFLFVCGGALGLLLDWRSGIIPAGAWGNICGTRGKACTIPPYCPSAPISWGVWALSLNGFDRRQTGSFWIWVTPSDTRGLLCSAHRNYSWWCSMEHRGCWGTNPGQQVPYLLSFHSSPP